LAALLLSKVGNQSRFDKDESGWTPFHIAASVGASQILTLMLNSLPEDQQEYIVNEANDINCTPLHYAGSKNHVECAKILLDSRSDYKAVDKYGQSVLHRAVGKNSRSFIEMLFEFDA
jgi:26S proteasome non-ATPase regulatory subunit 10